MSQPWLALFVKINKITPSKNTKNHINLCYLPKWFKMQCYGWNYFYFMIKYLCESIYIIKHCEKLNKDSANTMLKFLEEPEGSVIGFFITSHEDNVLPTIQSRCQHISVVFENFEYENYELSIVPIKYTMPAEG